MCTHLRSFPQRHILFRGGVGAFLDTSRFISIVPSHTSGVIELMNANVQTHCSGLKFTNYGYVPILLINTKVVKLGNTARTHASPFETVITLIK